MARRFSVLSALLTALWSIPASAQSTTSSGLTLNETLRQLTTGVGSAPVGEAIGLATALEVATAPFGTSSGGFVFTLDRSTGLQVRTATTFGPAFTERALTLGEGHVGVGVNFLVSTYDRLGDLTTKHMQLASTVGGTGPDVPRLGISSLVMTSKTLVVSGSVGVTDNLDVSVAIPMVTVSVNGISWVENSAGTVLQYASGGGESSGLGDVTARAKYRFVSFGTGQPDPGGIAVAVTESLPTGDRDNLRGLGVSRTRVSLIASSGRGRIRPHVNGGFEWWNKGVSVVADFRQNTVVTARHQVEYAGGVEFEAAPKLTLNVDLLGRHILGGGAVGFSTEIPPANSLGVTAIQSAVALPQGIDKLTLVPGLKVNLKGNLLLSLNALVALRDNGLHARLTPVGGIDLTF